MAVPGHDQRDWEFARKFGLEIVEVVRGGDVTKEAYVGDGVLVNSPLIDGLEVPEAKRKITRWLEEKGLGKAAVNYKLRDWVFSRQRYWGEPIPLRHVERAGGGREPQPLATFLLPPSLLFFAFPRCATSSVPRGRASPLDESELPLLLPEVESYQPTGTGESPLAGIRSWVEHQDPRTGRTALRETNTMPQWAGSCWYYLRFIDPQNGQRGWDPEKERYWMPVDLYVGGSEHAVLHLLYARFWHKVLYDLGHVSTPEPFLKLVHQGLILGEDGQKMSKSLGNVVNPDEVIAEYGADTMRLFEMFLGPLEVVFPVVASSFSRHTMLSSMFLGCEALDEDPDPGGPPLPPPDLEPDPRRIGPAAPRSDRRGGAGREPAADAPPHDRRGDGGHRGPALQYRHQPADGAGERAPGHRPVGEAPPLGGGNAGAPPLALRAARRGGALAEARPRREPRYDRWPEHDPSALIEDTVEVAVQVNGKVRDRLTVPAGAAEEEVRKLALERPRVQEFLTP